MSWFICLCTPLAPSTVQRQQEITLSAWPALGERSITHASLSSSPVMCSSHVLMLLLPPICPVVEGHLYQLPWLNQTVQMALPLLYVVHLTLPFSCGRACFPLFWVNLRKTHFQEQISALLRDTSDIKNQILPSCSSCCSSLWDLE